MFGFIIFCVLCYLLYRYDLKYAEYRLLKVEYTNNFIRYKIQRKMLNFFWFTRKSYNSEYTAKDEFHYIKSKLKFRQKRPIEKTIV